MTKSMITAVAFAAIFLGDAFAPSSAAGQDNILADLYGRGVHAFYAGKYLEAQQYLTTAIDKGLPDPRAYYFRGILANMQGRTYDAEQDWKEGARLEASGNVSVGIGRSLSRFQGTARLKLEEIRREARLQAASGAPTRTQVRLNEIKAAESTIAATRPRPRVPASSRPVIPAPIPPATDNPFADDGGLATGQAKVEKDDALAGAMQNPFKGGAAPPGGAAKGGGGDVFAGGADAGGGADPFGGGDAGADPFGGGGDARADPFGGGGGAMEDPFGGSDPFGN